MNLYLPACSQDGRKMLTLAYLLHPSVDIGPARCLHQQRLFVSETKYVSDAEKVLPYTSPRVPVLDYLA